METQPEFRERASTLDHAASTFLGHRPRLFGIAYRILGSASEAHCARSRRET
ncbi:hypothetical protein [Nonomuraea sp. NPDC050643]|uniref:hypothetical protein n=1 Tax=Nonomuraea sp. NPDC050643 TaxID=3155660 RepID=UPI0033D457B6